MPLKYLFTAVYRDGGVYRQTALDRSITEPNKRSAFFDVKKDELATFALSGGDKTYLVDLQDGHFEEDGELIWQPSDEGMLFAGPHKLIFWRQHQETTDVVVGSSTTYLLGWEGEGHQHVMTIT